MNYVECINMEYMSTRNESSYDLQLDAKFVRMFFASFDKYGKVERLKGDCIR